MNETKEYEVNTLTIPTTSIISNGTLHSTTSISVASTNGTIALNKDKILDILDEYSFNQVTIDHKVSEQELMKLKEVAPTYVEEIKENIAKNLAREIAKKISYTKKKEEDTNHFIGRCWVFTTEELTKLIEGVRNV